MRTSKVPGFNIQSWRRTLATLWVLFAVGICAAWQQDPPSNPKMLVRYLESFPSAKSSVSHIRLDSKVLLSGVSLSPSVQGKVDTLQTAQTPPFLLAGFRLDDIAPDSSTSERKDVFDGGCT